MKEYRQYTGEVCPSCDRGKLYYSKDILKCTNPRCDYSFKTTSSIDIKELIKKEHTSKSLEEDANEFLRSHGYGEYTKKY